ncbi:hypothetical protein AXG93_1054s1310 [Marchantia polymorpha subsp. ruderalis]|uniref:Uncharacterized protein n=1 Tax=Marchantia polymorpha subsp. ruderalis TaxID=1480154 RepID=A0A176WPX2_MARPO|nr:hypothetical protein AXG93_1054s1310 [Marchantia polymorpha subsp. ruderalis]
MDTVVVDEADGVPPRVPKLSMRPAYYGTRQRGEGERLDLARLYRLPALAEEGQPGRSRSGQVASGPVKQGRSEREPGGRERRKGRRKDGKKGGYPPPSPLNPSPTVGGREEGRGGRVKAGEKEEEGSVVGVRVGRGRGRGWGRGREEWVDAEK